MSSEKDSLIGKTKVMYTNKAKKEFIHCFYVAAAVPRKAGLHQYNTGDGR